MFKLKELLSTPTVAGFAQSTPEQLESLNQITRSQRDMLDGYNLKQILSGEQNG